MQNEKEINILLLSETGIGKSTFINSLVNYLQFNTFDDACEQIQQLRCVIPTKFIVMDDQFNERTVECESNDNESVANGASATLKTKSYLIKAPSNITLRIIDTPGIGDTQGIIRDTENQQDIMNYLSCITYLNAICILLKPNQTRCTIAFQYCINQVLSYLHKSAIENIMFVFTNTSNTFFTPGETINSLQKVLKYVELKQNIAIPFNKENIFCIDNEAFRFLLARKCGAKLGNEKIFTNSFSHSKSEYLRLIRHAKAVTPHVLNNTIFLSAVRRKFEDLCGSLNDMSDLLKSDAALLKKLHSMSGDIEKGDITDIENRMCKTEAERDNVFRNISKFVVFLRANSVVLFNDYSQGYITYLIDQEMSKDTEANRKSLRNYRNLLSHYENIKNIINMDTHTDLLLPSLICDELSSLHPELIKENSTNSSILNNEVEISLTEENTPVEQEIQEEEGESAPFNFDNWFKQLQQSATRVSNNIEKGAEYEELRKRFIKPEFNSNMTRNFNNPNYQKFNESDSKCPNPRFKKNPKSSNETSSKPSNERYRRRRNDRTSDGNLGARSSSLCFLDQLDSKEENDDFVSIDKSNDDFVFLDKTDTQSTRSRGGFQARSRGRGKGRGRGRGGGSSECNQYPKTGKGSNSSKTYVNNARGNRPNASRGNSSRQNRNTEEPKNVLQSMTSIFD